MKVAVIGCGRMGLALGSALARTGDDVFFASRDPKRVEALLRERGVRARAGALKEVAAHADLIVLATAWEDTRAALEAAAPLAGKTILSCVNAETADEPLAVGHTTSAAEEIASWAAGADVVEAFNGTYAEIVDLAPDLAVQQTVLYCGDSASGRSTVAAIIDRLGFDPLDAGPLRNARYLEPLAQLVVYLVRQAGYGPTGIHQQWIRQRDARGTRS